MEAGELDALQQIRALAERFAARELEPTALENDRYPFAPFNERAMKVAESVGLLDLTLPESRGGSGQGMTALAAALEAIAARDGSFAFLIFSQCLARDLLAQMDLDGGAEDGVKIMSGRSDLLSIPFYADPEDLPETVHAAPTARGFHLTGRMDDLTCLPVARWAIVPATLAGTVRLFLLELRQRRVLISEPVLSLGLRGCPTGDLRLEGAAVSPAGLFPEGGSERYRFLTDRYRGPLAAIALGILRGSYGTAYEYARTRYQGKKQIIQHDMVRRMLANMLAWLDLGGAGVLRVCETADQGEKPCTTEGLSVQELVCMAAAMACTDGVQVLGGYGYMREYGQEKRMRDAKQLQAVFGSSPVRMMRIMDRTAS